MTCVWTPDPACLGDKWDELDEDQQERALMLATSSLQTLTYNRVGSCPITIRPCPQAPPCGCWGSTEDVTPEGGFGLGDFGVGTFGVSPINWDGRWYNCSTCASRCAPMSEIDIPGPVGFIDSLRINGIEHDLASGDWRLDDGHLLVWQGDGPSPIPSTQNLNLPDTEVGTWSITYSKSYPVAPDGRIAVAYLALEFAEACKPRGKCSLPKGVTSVVRNGVSFSVEAGLFPGGLTGIQIVDTYILKWAPAGSPLRNAFVFSPRMKNARRTNSVPLRAGSSM